MAGAVDSILSLVPLTYRRDVMALALGAAMATAWFTLDARVANAEEAAKEVTVIQQQIATIKQDQAVAAARMGSIEGSASRTEAQVNLLVQTLISASPEGRPVPTAPGKPAH